MVHPLPDLLLHGYKFDFHLLICFLSATVSFHLESSSHPVSFKPLSRCHSSLVGNFSWSENLVLHFLPLNKMLQSWWFKQWGHILLAGLLAVPESRSSRSGCQQSLPAASIFTLCIWSPSYCILAGLSSVCAFLQLSLQGQKSHWIRDTPMASV